MKVSFLLSGIVAMLFSISTFAQQPDESRFSVKTLGMGLDEPMALSFLPDGRVLFVERKGKLKMYDPELDYISVVAEIATNTKYTNAAGRVREAEEGLMGIVVDPNFAENHWIYIYLADEKVNRHLLTRWEFIDDQLVESSRKVILEIPTQRQECCHAGGGMVFDKQGNLYLTVGDNTSGGGTDGYAPLDDRPGREPWDDQRGAANTNDLRGGIVRIKPLPDGTYAIPEGNLFPKGTPHTRPEIYTMGSRNPWRPDIDSHTGYLYWGEVGPDAAATTARGPIGYDEFNQAKKAGFFGWPYFSGRNEAYAQYDFETGQIGAPYEVSKPINNSKNNTGLRELPSPTPAFIWYPYEVSKDFPELGVSGRSATGLAVFHQDDFKNASRLWPGYFEGKIFISDFMRGWIMAVTIDENSDYVSMERFLPNENFSSLIDMGFAPNGDLYMLKYGSSWFAGADNSALVRIEYNAGNRPPIVKMKADKTNGKLPLKVNFTTEGTKDLDGDKLTYQWLVSRNESLFLNSKETNPSFNFTKPGLYTVKLMVKDDQGGETFMVEKINAGNSAPQIQIDLLQANQSFYFPNESVEYKIEVNDDEDGSLKSKGIQADQVAVNIDYMPESFDPIEISANYATNDLRTRFNTGYKLISNSDCGSCHLSKESSIGPSFMQIAKRYQHELNATDKLAAKVIEGGSGVWGDHAMAAHPQLNESSAKSMVNYILSFAEPELEDSGRKTDGHFRTEIPKNETGFGAYVLRAAYTDRGAEPITVEQIKYLRYPFLDPRKFDFSKSVELVDTPTRVLQLIGNQSYIAFEQIDLNQIESLDILVQASAKTHSAGGILEIRLGSPTGKLIGQAPIGVKDMVFRRRTESEETKPEEELEGKIGELKKYKLRNGESEFFLGQSQIIKIPITKTNEMNDLYLVANNPEAKSNQIIMSLSGIQFYKNAILK